MTTITVADEKGGVGKTTQAVCLAAELAQGGSRVLLVDADVQKNASQWATTRNKEHGERVPPITKIQLTGADIDHDLMALIPLYDHVVIDTPGADVPDVVAAMMVSDAIIVPAQTGEFDVYSLTTMNRMVKDARAYRKLRGLGEQRAYILGSHASPHARSKDNVEFMESCADFSELQLLPFMVVNRTAWKRVAKLGLSPREMREPDLKAVHECQLVRIAATDGIEAVSHIVHANEGSA